MYKINNYNDKFKIYELIDEENNSSLKVCPERGGIIISFKVHGEELLYLDKDTFYDINANIRGGIPILFPICGQLKSGKYELNGKEYAMKNHGVARNRAWEVIGTNTKDEASITLRLTSDEETMKEFPFEFELVFKYTLKKDKLIIEQKYQNKSNENMPMYAGFHPYFKTKHKNIAYTTDAKQYLDYNDMEIKNYEGSINLEGMKESTVFLDAKERKISFSMLDNEKSLHMRYGSEFKYIVLWQVDGKDFICVEPWMAKTWAMNTNEDLVFVDSGKELATYLAIEYK